MTTSRREWLSASACGFGTLALGGMLADCAGAGPLDPKPPHFEPTAKRVIFIFCYGGPSHVDTFDYKPELQRRDGQEPPAARGEVRKAVTSLLGSPFEFRRYGQCGHWISSLFPHLANHADKLCLVQGLNHKTLVHGQGQILMHTTSAQFPRPSAGSWISYGLGAETRDLPGFIVLNPQARAMSGYSSAFLPQVHTATPLMIARDVESVRNVTNGRIPSDQQRRQIDLIQAMNERLGTRLGGAGEVEAVIESYERGFRMQDGVPQVLDLRGETAETLRLYGLDHGDSAFARQCLYARRFAEAGVRFIEVTSGANQGPAGAWDHHNTIFPKIRTACDSTDLPIAGLLTDLQRRGLLDDTLVIWGGEFGRTPWRQGDGESVGRDHHAAGFTWWLAGGGVKPGHRHGATDDIGRFTVQDPVSVHDLWATVQHLMGLDPWNSTYRYGGREYRLADVEGKVVRGIVA